MSEYQHNPMDHDPAEEQDQAEIQYVGRMTIEAPEHVRQSYAGYLQEALDEVPGE